jgi:hypothetical protein
MKRILFFLFVVVCALNANAQYTQADSSNVKKVFKLNGTRVTVIDTDTALNKGDTGLTSAKAVRGYVANHTVNIQRFKDSIAALRLKQVATTSFTSAVLRITLADGTNIDVAVPTFNQSTTGSAASLATQRYIYGNLFNGTADVIATITDTYIASSGVWNIAYNKRISSTSFTDSTFRISLADGTNIDVAVPTFNQSTTGSSATLTTARNIQGVSFNGSSNIDILNGTGLVRMAGTTISYDTTTYVPASRTIAGFNLGSDITLAALTATNNTITFSGSYNTSTARNIAVNMGGTYNWTTSHTWTNGVHIMQRSVSSNTATPGLTLQSTNIATSGSQQYKAPYLSFKGNYWSAASGTNVTSEWRLIEGTVDPGNQVTQFAYFAVQYSADGGAYITSPLFFRSAAIGIGTNLPASGMILHVVGNTRLEGTVTTQLAAGIVKSNGVANTLTSVSTIVNADVSASANIDATKIATITSGNVLGNTGSGNASIPFKTVIADVVTTYTDANQTIATIGTFELPTITANRTVSLPSPSSFTGNTITVWNKNTSSSFGWSWNTNAPVDASGTTLSGITNLSIATLKSDGTVWLRASNSTASTVYTITASTYTVSAYNPYTLYIVDYSSGATTITLPSASSMSGKTLEVVTVTNNDVRINANGSDLFNPGGFNHDHIFSFHPDEATGNRGARFYSNGTYWVMLTGGGVGS